MIAREDDVLFHLALPRQFVALFLSVDEDEFEDKLRLRILGEDVLPKIGNAVLVLIERIALARVDALAPPHVEREEEGRLSVQAGRHIYLIEVHCKVDEAPRLKAEKPRFRIACVAELIDGVRIRLPRHVAFEFKRDDCQPVDEDDEIDALFLARSNLFHDGENILLVTRRRLFVERGRGLGIEQMKLDIRKLNAVFEKGQQAPPLLGRLGVEIADEGIFQPVLIYFTERRHRFGLGIGKEFQQQFPIDGKFIVEICMVAFDVPVVLHQPLDDIVFKFQFGKNVVHLWTPIF